MGRWGKFAPRGSDSLPLEGGRGGEIG